MSKFQRVERYNDTTILLWPEEDGQRMYGILWTAVRVPSLESARKIADTVRDTKNGREYDYELAEKLTLTS